MNSKVPLIIERPLDWQKVSQSLKWAKSGLDYKRVSL